MKKLQSFGIGRAFMSIALLALAAYVSMTGSNVFMNSSRGLVPAVMCMTTAFCLVTVVISLLLGDVSAYD